MSLTMSGQIKGNSCEVTHEAGHVRRPVDERAREAMQEKQRRATTHLLVLIPETVDIQERQG